MRRIKYKLIRLFLIFIFAYSLKLTTYSLFAQDDNRLSALSKQLIEAKADTELYAPFEELKELYFSRPEVKAEGGIPPQAGKENKYEEFIEFLKSLEAQKTALQPFTPLESPAASQRLFLTGFTNYYIALSRYRQLKYLEETQNWDEYFSQGNTYRDELVKAAQKSIDSTSVKEPLNIYARLILWQFHSDQQDAFHKSALTDLMSSLLEYSKEAAAALEPIKDAADRLSVYGERAKSRELYKIYIDKLASPSVKDEELGNTASGFYKENSLELCELAYDAYIDRIAKAYPKEKLLPVLAQIAGLFSYQEEGKEVKDALYAEKIFQRIEEIFGKDAFDENLTYLRAFNLEKNNDYDKAKDIYEDLLKRYPGSAYADEANYKTGIVYTYILHDIAAGRSFFEKLANTAAPGPNLKPAEGLTQKAAPSAQGIAGLYQLGLLSQWEEDSARAKEYYSKLISNAGADFSETVNLAQERLKEIERAKPIEYNLKTFLDVSLKEENTGLEITKIDSKSVFYKTKKGRKIEVGSIIGGGENGCLQPQWQYLWSGHTGTAKPATGDSGFNTSYTQPGTKEINLVVVSPAGILGRSLQMIDVN